MSPIIFSSCSLKLVSLSSNERNEVTSSSSDLNSNIEKKIGAGIDKQRPIEAFKSYGKSMSHWKTNLIQLTYKFDDGYWVSVISSFSLVSTIP